MVDGSNYTASASIGSFATWTQILVNRTSGLLNLMDEMQDRLGEITGIATGESDLKTE